MQIKCENCPWYWYNEDYRRYSCNYYLEDGDAPCEWEEPNEDDSEEENG